MLNNITVYCEYHADTLVYDCSPPSSPIITMPARPTKTIPVMRSSGRSAGGSLLFGKIAVTNMKAGMTSPVHCFYGMPLSQV